MCAEMFAYCLWNYTVVNSELYCSEYGQHRVQKASDLNRNVGQTNVTDLRS